MSTGAKAAVARPDTFDSLKELIAKRYPDFRGQMKRIAEYAIENPNEMALKTVAQIADDVGVQPSSMVRFAKGLGYEGFSDIQSVFRTRLMNAPAGHVERIRGHRREHRLTEHGLTEHGDTPDAVLSDFVERGIESLDMLRSQTAPEKIARAVRILANANDIYLLAQRRAFPVAFYLGYALARLEQRSILLDGVGGLLAQQASLATRQDAVVAVSFRPYTPTVVDIVTERSEKGVPIISITDSALSPLVLESTVSFETPELEDSGFRTLLAPMCLAQALVVSLGHQLAAIENGGGQP